jgi:transcriptional antiterminator RfaH
MFTFSTGWYIMYTRPKNEKKLVTKLAAKHIDCYVPLIRVVRKWHDRRKVLLEPAFACYAFVFLKTITDYFDAVNMDGAVSYVKVGEQPAVLKQEVIDQIKTVVCQDNVEVSTDNYTPGTKVLIYNGAFAGTECEVIKYNGHHKILVRVSLLGRSIVADMPKTCFIAGPAA